MKELIEYLERKIELCTEMNMPLEKFAYTDALKKARALQLQQTGVKSSVSIELKDWDYECADGCCTTFGTKLLLNGKELEHPNKEILDNSYVGCDVETALHAVLKELGYNVKFV
jgi:hypothetical protein